MALPHLVKHIYNHATDEVIRRGKKIYATGNAELVEYDDLLSTVAFRIKDDSYATFYRVHILNYKDPKTLSLRCTCPYNLSEICRHKAASLFALQEMLDKNQLGEREIVYDQKHTIVKMKLLDLKMIKLLSSAENYSLADTYLNKQKAIILEAKDERVKAEVEVDGQKFKLLLQKNEERNFDTSCTCDSDSKHPLCLHKTILFLQLLNTYGVNYFDSIRNWDKEKNKLLQLYGYSLTDDLTGKFEFTYKDGKPFLRLLDPSIKRIVQQPTEPKFRPSYAPPPVEEHKEEEEKSAPMKLGIVFSFNERNYPFLQTEAIQGEPDADKTKYTGKIDLLDLGKYVNTEVFDEDDKLLVQALRKLQPSEVGRHLSRNSPFSAIWENIITHKDDQLPDETKHLMVEYLLPRLRKIFNDTESSAYVFFLPSGKKLSSSTIQTIHLNTTPVLPSFVIKYENGKYAMSCKVKLPYQEIPLDENKSESPLLFLHDDVLYIWEKAEDVALVEKFAAKNKMVFSESEWPTYLQQFVLPLAKDYDVSFENVRREEVKDVKPETRLLLKEKGDYLLFQPVFIYSDYEVRVNDKEKIILPKQDRLLVITRDLEAEKQFIEKIEALHSQFIRPQGTNNLVLKGADVLRNNWFFLFIDAMKEMEVPVYGFDALKNFRFNTAKPSTKIYISSHTDWFDAKVEIQFGEQKITVADVKKALANKQQFVQLQDGSLGILPEEWIKKYSLLFRVGEGKTNEVKLSRFHFSVIEELYESRNEEELFFQLEEKYEKIKESHAIKEIEAPKHLQPILRPYQTSGFHWLNYLREIQWGGILADDMGLGKTIQALSFLQHLKDEHRKIKTLVVCPTTLMYNWENEIKKFTPSLTYYIHHGGTRTKDTVLNPDIEVIITTYGTLRSDIKIFVEQPFDYVILDESQAIKNPSSKVTKAAGLLRAKNRLCLSGTPLQNNTFDIYAQMNFLNPGMLGSIEFFKQEFSIPIDKFGEQEQKEHLRRLLYPFILRRTKEQVAKDLPEKTEMILFCEMGDEQRKIYDAYRNDFRDKILGVVQEQGIQKSQLTILQGLMKLRQICDSPAIMKEKDEEKFPNVSIKLDELTREITENISNHKALVFSQFLGMLALIKERLTELGVKYEYFDGSTSAPDREKAIQNFQNQEECRVFLISLKAGGVGLNLTAADYVYIVDPWWNPAVEQQAIDRTHRIGQTKSIFAYRMICKDTVEDKILKLQEKKRSLAKDLITDDDGFVKSLTKEDVEYLFS
jgi:non-specific serine/threonine protein kinase